MLNKIRSSVSDQIVKNMELSELLYQGIRGTGRGRGCGLIAALDTHEDRQELQKTWILGKIIEDEEQWY